MKLRRIILAFILFISLFISACGPVQSNDDSVHGSSDASDPPETYDTSKTPETPEHSESHDITAFSNQNEGTNNSLQPVSLGSRTESISDLVVHFINVGQADCILIQLPNSQVMLIDGGDQSTSARVVEYLHQAGVVTIEYMVATHPHEDHIGGLPAVLEAFEVSNIYMPRVSNNTQIFETLLLTIQEKGLSVKTARAGVSILSEPDLQIDIVAPVEESYSELNDYSAVIKITYGSVSFLFAGDAEAVSENQITADISADVLKVGHHGSDTSSSESFIRNVNPTYAVISVGRNNSYGHPSDVILNRLANAGASVYRTDEAGDIVAISDGQTITISSSFAASPLSPPESEAPSSSESPSLPASQSLSGSSSPSVSPSQSESASPSESPSPSPPESASPSASPLSQQPPSPSSTPDEPDNSSVIVYITNTGTKYHRDGCRYLSQSKIPISLEKAKLSYGPCSTCKPPQ